MRPSQKFTTLVITLLVLCSCDGKFRQRIASSKQQGFSKHYPVGVGLPFFVSKTMDAVWHKNINLPVVKINRLEMTDHRGMQRTADLFIGKPSFVAFFFSTCGGFCPMIIENLKRIERVLPKGTAAQFIAISVDPENDTPKRLGAYANARIKGDNSKNWYLLTGSREELTRLAGDVFAIEAFKKKKNMRIVHSERVFMLDSDGYLRAVYNGTKTNLAKQVAEDFALLTERMSISAK